MNLELGLPQLLPATVDRDVIARAVESKARAAFAFIVGTKPCFNKVYGSIRACERAGVPFFIVDAGQHHDANLVHGLKEFDLAKHIGASLNIRGDLNQKCAEMFVKVPAFVGWLRQNWNKPVIPIVNGDTILCPIIPAAWMFETGEMLAVQHEAGLRSFRPDIATSFPINVRINTQRYGTWLLDKREPFPEQWDTYCASAGC